MPTLKFLFYLAAIGVAYLFKLSYLGWFGPYLLAAVIFVPILLLFLSLPSMLSTSIELYTLSYYSQNSKAPLQIKIKASRLLPINSMCIHLEIENLFAGEHSKEKHSFQSVSTGEKTLSLPTALCGTLRCRIVRFECRDMLGLFALKRKCFSVAYCTILPEAKKPDTPVNIEAALQTAVRLKPKYRG